MSDAPKPPAEPTESVVASAALPPASSTDSAPPPSPHSPAPVPPRNYTQTPVYIPAPPAYAPNSSVPRFLRAVAALVFVGGTIGAAVAWVYKNVIYPRLVISLRARSRLFAVHEAAYAKLFDALRAFTISTGIARLGGTEAIEHRRRLKEEQAERAAARSAQEVDSVEQVEGKEEEKPLLQEQEASAGEGDAGEGTAGADRQLPPPPQLLAPLHASLGALRTELQSASPTSPASTSAHVSTNPSNLVQPQGTLMRSLVTLNEYLESETYAASTFHTYRPYGAYGSAGSSTATGERKALQESAHNFKAEIRSIKGALLNRRNFVSRPEGATA
ncbi:uncharacterized protein JCM10292_003145 [Rhodotorula paludigena]|uniref:uncharacterized protein n=1 Tax=Rhodotorula paludigena TaxID=86838 RepID=UPI00317CBC89